MRVADTPASPYLGVVALMSLQQTPTLKRRRGGWAGATGRSGAVVGRAARREQHAGGSKFAGAPQAYVDLHQLSGGPIRSHPPLAQPQDRDHALIVSLGAPGGESHACIGASTGALVMWRARITVSADGVAGGVGTTHRGAEEPPRPLPPPAPAPDQGSYEYEY